MHLAKLIRPLRNSLVPMLLAMAALATPSDAPAEWRQITPGLTLEFPRDHGAHRDTQTEWWYLTGQLESADGRRFGFQFTIFRRGLAAGPINDDSSPLRARQVLAGHFALTDVASGRTHFVERLRRMGSPLASAADDDLDLTVENWSLRRSEEDRLELRASDLAAGIGLQLDLVPTKPLVLHGKDGYSAKGSQPGNASAYSSWTRLASSGSIRIGNETLAVNGEAWFDHEFGTSVLEPGVVGWDWFGLQLADGSDLMLFVLRREDGIAPKTAAGTLVTADGKVQALAGEDFSVEAKSTWLSPQSGASYPASWSISVPSADLAFEVVPVVADCELRSAGSTDVVYWEGPVELRELSTRLGEQAPSQSTRLGRGYAELTGYAGTMQGRF